MIKYAVLCNVNHVMTWGKEMEMKLNSPLKAMHLKEEFPDVQH